MLIARTVHPQARARVAAAFPDQKVLAYEDNLSFVRGEGYDISELTDDEFLSWVEQLLLNVARSSAAAPCRVFVDVSSFSRYRIAVLAEAIRVAATLVPVEAHFVYALAEFSAPPAVQAANRHVGPVTPAFAGWFTEPDLPTVAILGLGYEQDRALGAVEHVQTSEVWTFSPTSGIDHYERALRVANDVLLSTVPASHRFTYRVQQSFETFAILESLLARASVDGNVILFPFGPKVFSVCCLVAGMLYPELAVWRVSPGAADAPLARTANGEICGLVVTASRDLVAQLTDPSSPAATRAPEIGVDDLGVNQA